MSPLLHSLQVTTLATWLGVAGFGVVGLVLRDREPTRSPDSGFPETQWIPDEIVLGGESSADTEQVAVESPDSAPAEALPAPPELPDLAELAPLPEVPEFPSAEVPSQANDVPRISRQAAPTENASPNPQPPARRPANSGSRSQGNSKPGAKPGGGSGMSNAARLAAGNMPSPSYPAEARRKGQTGTVVVEFTVDASGRVISAYAKSASPWSLLNEEAVRTVRRWKFPPGGIMKLQRPIVFQLR